MLATRQGASTLNPTWQRHRQRLERVLGLSPSPVRPPASWDDPADLAGAAEIPTWAVFGAHGGAGATTVAALLDPHTRDDAVEMRCGYDSPPGGAHSVLVARTTAYGLARAARWLLIWPGPAPVLVLSADAPSPPPDAAEQLLKALLPSCAGAVFLPWLWPLREASDPYDIIGVRPVRRAAATLAADLAQQLMRAGSRLDA